MSAGARITKTEAIAAANALVQHCAQLLVEAGLGCVVIGLLPMPEGDIVGVIPLTVGSLNSEEMRDLYLRLAANHDAGRVEVRRKVHMEGRGIISDEVVDPGAPKS